MSQNFRGIAQTGENFSYMPETTDARS